MHRGRPARGAAPGPRAAAIIGPGALAAAPAWAANAAVSTGAGPWIFAGIALVLVAVLAWWLGRLGAGGAHAKLRSAETTTTRGADAARIAPGGGAGASWPAPSPGSLASPAPSRAPVASGGAGMTAAAAVASVAAPAVDDAAAITYALSHDLRAPLRVVEGFARILKEDYGRQLDRIGNDHLDRLLGASARMNTMIEAMLSMAQLSTQPLQRQAVNLSQIAGLVIDDLRRLHPERQVAVEIAPGLMALGDATLLRQLLENLLGNAWKYSARQPAARISFKAVMHRGLSAFEVADNGAGFDMRAAERLFGLFQRLHGQSEFPGTGVGLASVQRIVQRHGGRIWAESEPGLGARFYFTLAG